MSEWPVNSNEPKTPKKTLSVSSPAFGSTNTTPRSSLQNQPQNFPKEISFSHENKIFKIDKSKETQPKFPPKDKPPKSRPNSQAQNYNYKNNSNPKPDNVQKPSNPSSHQPRPSSTQQNQPALNTGGSQSKKSSISPEKKSTNTPAVKEQETIRSTKAKNTSQKEEKLVDWAKPLKKLKKQLGGYFPVNIEPSKELSKQKKAFLEDQEENKNRNPEAQAKHSLRMWPRVKLIRIADVIAKYNGEKKSDIKNPRNPGNLISQLMKERRKKRMSKMKKAKILYFSMTGKSHPLPTDTTKKTEKQKPFPLPGEQSDGFVTVDDSEEEESKEEKREENKEEEKIEIKYAEIPEDLKDIVFPPVKKPQIQYNLITLRSWVDHILCPEIDELVLNILNRLAYLQIQKKLQQPNKGKFKRRIMCGMREAIRSVETNLNDRSSKCLVIALNIQENPLKDGTDEKMVEIIAKAKLKGIPIVHSCTRKLLGQACTGNQAAKISIVSIVNYSGCEEMFKDLMRILEEKKKEFQEKASTPKDT